MLNSPRYRNIAPFFLWCMFGAIFLNAALCETLYRVTSIATFAKWPRLLFGIHYTHAFSFILVFGAMLYTRRPLSHFGLHLNVRGQWKVVRWWFLGFLCFPLGYAILHSFPVSKFVQSVSAPDGPHNWHVMRFIMVAFVSIAFGEELIFRGLFLTELSRHKTGWLRVGRLRISKANFLQALCFGLGHMANVGWVVWWRNPTAWDYAWPLAVQPVGSFIGGLIFGHLRERTGGLFWPVLMHFLIGDIGNIYVMVLFIGRGIATLQ